MKKNYDSPFFEITRFSFEEILADGMVDISVTESPVVTDGNTDDFN